MTNIEARQRRFDLWINGIPGKENQSKGRKPILIIQQKDDPQGKSKEVYEIIENYIELIEIPGHLSLGSETIITSFEYLVSFFSYFFLRVFHTCLACVHRIQADPHGF